MKSSQYLGHPTILCWIFILLLPFVLFLPELHFIRLSLDARTSFWILLKKVVVFNRYVCDQLSRIE